MASNQEFEERLTAALADRYTIEREIGSGGTATIYLAEDLKHGRKVAIKVLDPELATAVRAERFLREMETIAHLSHPHILPLHDSGEAEGFLYYVMPYVKGESFWAFRLSWSIGPPLRPRPPRRSGTWPGFPTSFMANSVSLFGFGPARRQE